MKSIQVVIEFIAKKISKSINYRENTSLKATRKFIDRIKKIKSKCFNFVKKEVKKGKTVMVYGASTKGNTILQFFKLDNKLIKYAAERTPQKWGKYTVGTGIKIISEKEARKMKPDYFLVLPVAFINEFIKREKLAKKWWKIYCSFSKV